jgi:hypothetical protein
MLSGVQFKKKIGCLADQKVRPKDLRQAFYAAQSG